MTVATPAQNQSPPAVSPPNLRPATFDDYAEVARLESFHGLASFRADDWRRLWLDNPLWPRLGKSWPVGWIMEDAAGRAVGTLSNIPSRYAFRGRELTCANGKSWVVEPEYRGMALWLFGEYFGQEGVDLFINTTVSYISGPVIAQTSDRIPLGDWQSAAYWLTGHRGFARSALRIKNVPLAGLLAIPAGVALRLKDAVSVRRPPRAPASIDVARIDRFDARFDAFWEESVRQNPDKLLGWRDSQTLNWHYGVPLRAGRLRVWAASRDGLLRGYCVLKPQWMPQGLRCMRLVDYQTVEPAGPADGLLPGLLRAALAGCAADGVHILEHLSRGLPKTSGLDALAPYRRQLQAWPFYYQAADPAFHEALRSPAYWDPSPYDGDASFDCHAAE